MLLPIKFASINEPVHLRPGKYRVTCSTYVSPSRSECAFQFEYQLAGRANRYCDRHDFCGT